MDQVATIKFDFHRKLITDLYFHRYMYKTSLKLDTMKSTNIYY